MQEKVIFTTSMAKYIISIFIILWAFPGYAQEEREVRTDQRVSKYADTTPTTGTIKRKWGNAGDDYSWNGHILRRTWGSNQDEWTFDGKQLRRTWETGRDEFDWDGETLQRRWNPGNDIFTWDGETLKREWNTGDDEFTIEATFAKSIWNNKEDEWVITGHVPIPVIAIVILGIAKRNP